MNQSDRFRILLMILLGFASVARAQEESVERFNGLLAVQVGIPTGGMQRAIENRMGNTGFGLGFSALSNPFSWGKKKRNSPLRIGGELGYTYYGRFITDVDIGGYRGDYKTSYGILNLNAVLQLRPGQAELISPFLEILAGGSFYLSSIRENLGAIESALGIPSFELDAYSSASFNRGVAFGCTIGRVRNGQGRFTIRGSYNIGSDIKYIVRNSLQYDPYSGWLTYDVGQAPVRYFLVQVGIGF